MIFDISELEFTKWDIKRIIKLPLEINPELCEEIGIHIGDGSIYLTKRRSEFRVAGNPKEEWKYFENFLVPLYFKLFNIKTKPRKDGKAICLPIYSRAIVTFKTKILKLPSGRKASTIDIPKFILENKKFLIPCLRGIFDTDGSIYWDSYTRRPVIDISSSSHSLIETIRKNTMKLGFCPTKSGETSIKFHSWRQVLKWFKIIGSHNPKNINRFKEMLVQGS